MTYKTPSGHTIQIFRTWNGAWFDVRNDDDVSVSFTHVLNPGAEDMIATIERSAQ